MMKRVRTLFAAVFLIAAGCTTEERRDIQWHDWNRGEWIDLTHEFSEETLFWPTSSTFRLDTVYAGVTDGGFYYEAYEFFTAEHGGTHLDAPIHFSEGGQTADQIEISRLTGYAAVIDVSAQADEDREYRIRTEDITQWEEENGRLPEDVILLFYTGFSQYWPDAEQYLGTERRGEEGVAELSFPGIHPETAEWLVENRPVKAVGIDTASLDYGPSEQFEAHRVFAAENIPGFENVANLDRLPPTGAFVIALPMKIKDGSGAPLRIVAHVGE